MLLQVFIAAIAAPEGLNVSDVFHCCFYTEAFDLEAILLCCLWLWKAVPKLKREYQVGKFQQNQACGHLLSNILQLLKRLDPFIEAGIWFT